MFPATALSHNTAQCTQLLVYTIQRVQVCDWSPTTRIKVFEINL